MAKNVQKQGQENARKWRSFRTSKTHCFTAKIINCHSFVFIPVYVKRLNDPSGLSSDAYLCFRIANPSLSFIRVENPMAHLDHHALTFNGIYTSVKRNPHNFREKNLTCKFRHGGITSTLSPLRINRKKMTVKIQCIDNQQRLFWKAKVLGGYLLNVNKCGYIYQNKIKQL